MKLKSLRGLFYDAVSSVFRLDEVARIRQRPGFSTSPVHVGFVVNIVALRQVVTEIILVLIPQVVCV